MGKANMMSSRLDELNADQVAHFVETIEKQPPEVQKQIFAHLARQFATRGEEAPVFDDKGTVAGYFVPADLRMKLTTAEFRRQLQASKDNPGPTTPLSEVISRLETKYGEK